MRSPTPSGAPSLALAVGLIVATALATATPAAAQNEVRLEDLPEPPPPPPPPVQSGEPLESFEPDIKIIQRKDATVEEYRVNGRLFLVKIKPAVGPSYYLSDNDGDGNFETRLSKVYSDFIVPKWVLFSW